MINHFVTHYLDINGLCRGKINCRSLPTSICNVSMNSRWTSNLSKLYVPVLLQSRKILHSICRNKTGHFRCTLMWIYVPIFTLMQASVRRKNKVLFSSPQNKGKKEAGIWPKFALLHLRWERPFLSGLCWNLETETTKQKSVSQCWNFFTI